MAKKEQSAEEKKAAKAERAKNKGPRQNYITLTSNNPNVQVRVQHIRQFGCHIETTVFDGEVGAKGSKPVSVSTYFVMGVKPKSKKEDKFLVKDNGPKPKKEKKEKTEDKKKASKK